MGYNIEVSFNVLKQSNISELEDKIINIATENGCNDYYDNYEFERNCQYQRNHYVITVHFSNNVHLIVKFLKNIKKIKGLNIETIYRDETHDLLYASRYYITQMMDKHLAKKYKSNKKEKTYSEDDIMILSTLSTFKKSGAKDD